MILQQSINWINQAIEATNALITHYENPDNTDKLHPCPYCILSSINCGECPYTIIFDGYCETIWENEFYYYRVMQQITYSEFAISRAKHLRKLMLPKLRKLKRELENKNV